LISLETIEDTIKHHFDITDSINVVSTYYGSNVDDGHVRVFVDHNTESIFHDEILSDYGCDCIDEKLYNSLYYDKLEKYKDSIDIDHHKFTELFGHWVPIRKGKDGFYLERIVCEFNRRGFTLSDSAFITYSMDGPFPDLLLNISQKGRELIFKTSDGPFKLERLEGEEIYVHDGHYLMHSRYMNFYPVEVIDCHAVGAPMKVGR
jgi:hypothetical protein